MTKTYFIPGEILYAANLNESFANSVNIAGDNVYGNLVVANLTSNASVTTDTLYANSASILNLTVTNGNTTLQYSNIEHLTANSGNVTLFYANISNLVANTGNITLDSLTTNQLTANSGNVTLQQANISNLVANSGNVTLNSITVNQLTTNNGNLTVYSANISNLVANNGNVTLNSLATNQLIANNGNVTLQSIAVNQLTANNGNLTVQYANISNLVANTGNVTLNSLAVNQLIANNGNVTLNSIATNNLTANNGNTTLSYANISNLVVNTGNVTLHSIAVNQLTANNGNITVQYANVNQLTANNGNVTLSSLATNQLTANNGNVTLNSISVNQLTANSGNLTVQYANVSNLVANNGNVTLHSIAVNQLSTNNGNVNLTTVNSSIITSNSANLKFIFTDEIILNSNTKITEFDPRYPEYIYGIKDGSGNYTSLMKRDGTWEIARLNVSSGNVTISTSTIEIANINVAFANTITIGNTTFTKIDPRLANYISGYKDSDDNYTVLIRKDGTWEFANIDIHMSTIRNGNISAYNVSVGNTSLVNNLDPRLSNYKYGIKDSYGNYSALMTNDGIWEFANVGMNGGYISNSRIITTENLSIFGTNQNQMDPRLANYIYGFKDSNDNFSTLMKKDGTWEFSNTHIISANIAHDRLIAFDPRLSGYSYGFKDKNGNFNALLSKEGIWEFSNVVITNARVTGNLVANLTQASGNTGLFSNTPSYAINVTDHGAVGDGKSAYVYANWSANGSSITISKFFGKVVANVGEDTINIVGTLNDGIGFNVGDEGDVIFLEGLGTASSNLETTITQVLSDQLIRIATTIGTASTTADADKNVVWPGFASSAVNKIIWIDNAYPRMYWDPPIIGLTQRIDYTDTLPTQPMLDRITAVNSAIQITISGTIPNIGRNGLPTHIEYGTDNGPFIANAATEMVKQNKKHLYFPSSNSRYFVSSLRSGDSRYKSFTTITPLHNSANSHTALYDAIWIGDPSRKYSSPGFVVNTSAIPTSKKIIPLTASKNIPHIKSVVGRPHFRNSTSKTTANVMIIGDSLSVTSGQNNSPMFYKPAVFMEKLRNDNPQVEFTMTDMGRGGSTMADLDKLYQIGNATQFYWVRDINKSWMWHIQNNFKLADIVYLAQSGRNDGYGFHPLHAASVINQLKAIPTNPDIILETMQKFGTSSIGATDRGENGSLFGSGVLRGMAYNMGIGLIDYNPYSFMVVDGFDPLRKSEMTLPQHISTISNTTPYTLGVSVNDFGGYFTLVGNSNTVWDDLGILSIQISQKEDNVVQLREDPTTGNLSYRIITYGATVDTFCNIAAGNNILTTSGHHRVYTDMFAYKYPWTFFNINANGSSFLASNTNSCILLSSGDSDRYSASVFKEWRTFIRSSPNSNVAFVGEAAPNNLDNDVSNTFITFGGVLFHPQDGNAQTNIIITGAGVAGADLSTKILQYNSNTQVVLADVASTTITPSSEIPVFIGRTTDWKQTDINISNDTGANPILDFSVKGKIINIRYFPNSNTGMYTEPPTAVLALPVERFVGLFVPKFTSSGPGTVTIQGKHLFIDDDLYYMPEHTPTELMGDNSAALLNNNKYAGNGTHPGSIYAEKVIRPVLEINNFSFT